MTLTKAQLAILAEVARTGLPLTYHGGICKVGEKVTTVPLRRALLAAGMVRSEIPGQCAFNTPLVLTDAGREWGERHLEVMGLASHGWVRFGDVAIKRCRQQAQYAARYIDGRHGQPNLGTRLGSPVNTAVG